MVSFADLRDIDPFVFRQGESSWSTMYNQIKERGYEVRRALDKLEPWTGAAAEGAKATFREREQRLLASSDTLQAAQQLFRQAGDRIGAAKAKIMEGAPEIAYWGLSVANDGTIFDDNARNRYGWEAQSIRELINKYQPVFRDALAEANRADAEIAAGLRRLTAEAVGLAPPAGDATTTAAATSIPPRGTAPADVKQWWDSLTPMQQESLLFTRAAELGSLDGIPAVARDRANRFKLAEEKAELLADQQRLLAKPRTHEEEQWLKQVTDKLRGIDDIERRLNTIDPSHREAFLLAIDGTGNGRAIIAAGNPDTATNVATFIPGTSSNLSTVGGDLNRSDLMLGAAADAGSASTSVITWVGYDAPQDLPEAALERYADGAKKDLDRFQDGLRASHEGPPSHNTVIGHSYGSTVIGHAARDEGLNADELVFVGSPGVGANQASDLNFPTDHVHATVAKNDIIHLSNVPDPFDVHGPDPTGSAFGANVFTSAPGTEGPWYTGGYSGAAHSEYWDERNLGLENMGRVIAGQPTR